MDAKQLIAWKRSLLEKCERLRTNLQEFKEELGKTTQQIELVDRLLGLASPGQDCTAAKLGLRAPDSVVEALIEVLGSEGTPLHISALVKEFHSRGWRIPGRGLESNLIAYLSRDSRFERVAKGTYGLASCASTGGDQK